MITVSKPYRPYQTPKAPKLLKPFKPYQQRMAGVVGLNQLSSDTHDNGFGSMVTDYTIQFTLAGGHAPIFSSVNYSSNGMYSGAGGIGGSFMVSVAAGQTLTITASLVDGSGAMRPGPGRSFDLVGPPL